jgi:hypothetical protein
MQVQSLGVVFTISDSTIGDCNRHRITSRDFRPRECVFRCDEYYRITRWRNQRHETFCACGDGSRISTIWDLVIRHIVMLGLREGNKKSFVKLVVLSSSYWE